MKTNNKLNYVTLLAICLTVFTFYEVNAQNNRLTNQYAVSASDAKGCTSTANSGVDFSVCSGGIVGLNGSFAGAASSAEWKGGLGSFDPDRFDPQADYYPDPLEFGTIVTLWLVTDDPPGLCLPDSDDVAITIILS